MPIRRAAAALALALLVAVAAGAALAYWTGSGQPLSGTGAAVAASVDQGEVPAVSAAGHSTVVVDWSASKMSDGGPVDGYLVRRYDAATGAGETIGAGCSGTITATTCTETQIPVGSWKYTVTPVVGSNWRGAESTRSAEITTTTIDFEQPITSPEAARAGPAGAAKGDIDNDGDIDIVTANFFEVSASTLINNGVGDFREVTLNAGAATADVGLGNFDGDANLDLVLLYQSTPPGLGTVAIFKGAGNGGFSFTGGTNASVNTGVRPISIVVGNFNGDAIDDVAVVNAQNSPGTENGTVMTFLGNAAGNDTFAAATPAQTLPVQLGAGDAVHADFNGGASDLAVVNYASNSVSLLAGNGAGFGAASHLAAGASPQFLTAADLNGDGNRDIVASVRNSQPSQLRVLLGNGGGGFPSQTTIATADGGGGAPNGVIAEDLDGDGDADVGVANGSSTTISVLDNDGNGTLSPVPTSPEAGAGAPGVTPFELVSADFDGNGYKDLAATNLFSSPGQVPVLLNQGGARANLAITQSDSPDPVDAGSTLTYSLTATNAGPGTPTSVKASDTLPAGVSFDPVASSPTCTAAGTAPVTVTCDYGSVAPGSPESQQVAVTVGAAAASPLANTATVAGNLADPAPADNTSSSTTTVILDSQPPTHSLSLDSANGAFLSGATLYYKRNAAGSFRLVDALSDAGSGPASVTYPAVTTSGWTHAAETVTTPAGGPYTSSTFSWTSNLGNPTGYSVSGSDVAGNASSSPLTFVVDTTAPSGGSVGYTNGLVLETSIPVTTANGSDGGSGVNAGSGIVRRAQATLNTSTQTCGTFGGFSTTVTLVGGADTSVVSGFCYRYQYLVSDNVGNQATYSSGSTARVDTTPYADSVLASSSLVNYWRLGESLISSDTFTGTAGTLLQNRSGELGADWTTFGSSETNTVLTNANRVRRNGTGGSMYSSSGVPPSADYSVRAEVFVGSYLTQDAVNVLGRIAPSGDNFYLARYFRNSSFGAGAWGLYKIVNGAATQLGSTTAVALSPGQTHELELRMVGSSISLWVNGAQLTSATDTTFTAAGKAGLRLGYGGASPAPTNTTGVHADNYRVTPVAKDAKGSNDGFYANHSTLGLTGALSSDADTAVGFDGIDDYVDVARQIQDDLSIEFWFKSTQGAGTNAQWWGNAGLVDAEVGGAANDFGVSLRSDGRVVAGIGTPDVSIVSAPSGLNDGAWHQVVFTRNRTSGALALYVDGSPAGTASGASTASLTSSANISLGRIATGSNYFAGTLDEVALYNTVLPAATVSDHYTRR